MPETRIQTIFHVHFILLFSNESKWNEESNNTNRFTAVHTHTHTNSLRYIIIGIMNDTRSSVICPFVSSPAVSIRNRFFKMNKSNNKSTLSTTSRPMHLSRISNKSKCWKIIFDLKLNKFDLECKQSHGYIWIIRSNPISVYWLHT